MKKRKGSRAEDYRSKKKLIDEHAEVANEYRALSAKVGWSKAKDLVYDTFSDNPEYKDMYKQEVLDAMRERDSFYQANQDQLNMVDSFTAGAIEEIANVPKFGARLALLATTGGLSAGASAVAQTGVNLATQAGVGMMEANYESDRYQGRLLTPKENLQVGAQEIGFDVLMLGAGAIMRKGKSAILKNAPIQGDIDVDVRSIIGATDDIGVYPGAKKQQIFTDFSADELMHLEALESSYKQNIKDNSFGGRLYNQKKVNILNDPYLNAKKDPVDYYLKTAFDSIEDPAVKDRLMQNTYERLTEFYNNPKLPQNTVLQRKVTMSKSITSFFGRDYIGYEKLFKPEVDNIKLKLDEKYGKGFSNKTPLQKTIIIQNQENSLVEDVAKAIDPSLQDYYARWQKNSDISDIKAQDTDFATQQLRRKLNGIHSKFENQKLYVQNEYINTLNKGYDELPLTLNQHVDNFGADEKTISQAWIMGDTSNVKGDRNGFLQMAYDDSVLLDELKMKTSLFDIKEFEDFNRKFGNSFDEYGDIKYYGNLFENLARANEPDKELLIRAMKDNPEQYVEFIYNSKKILDGGQGTVANKELLEKATNELKTLKRQKNQYKTDNLDTKIDAINDTYANNVNRLNQKIESIQSEINELSNKKVKGKKQKIKDLQDTIDDLKQQIKNEDKILKDRKSKVKSQYDKEYLNEDIKSKQDYIKKLKEIKESVQAEDIKKFEDFFEKPYDSVKKYINKNKDFINAEYDKLIKEIPVEVSKDPKIWKREVATAIARNKKKLAEESIKINQTINKRKMYKEMGSYFEKTKDKGGININNWQEAKIKPEKQQDFDMMIKPFFEDGTFSNPDNLPEHVRFAEFYANFKKTRKTAKLIDEYQSVGELRGFFNDGKMPEFFINYRSVKGDDFLKTNREMINDIMDFNTTNIARFLEYGSTSPYVLANKFQYGFKRSYANVHKNLYGVEPNQVITDIIDKKVKFEIDRFFKNTQIGWGNEKPGKAVRVSRKLRSIVSRGTLGFTGAGELTGQNYIMALQRSQKYAGLSTYTNTVDFLMRKQAKGAQFDNPNAKYTLGYLKNNVGFTKQSNDNIPQYVLNKYDDIAFWLQQYSDKQAKGAGEIMSTITLDHLPKSFDLLENEMKDLLKQQGLDPSDYLSFRDYVKNHISENGDFININQLSKSIEMQEYQSNFADILRNTHYQLSDYMGNVRHDSKFNTMIMDEASQWWHMFRSFDKALNVDTLDRFFHYVDANGVSKSRFGKTIINTEYMRDMGVAGVSKETIGAGAIAGLAFISGLNYSMSKEIAQSDRTWNQKMAAIKTRNDSIVEAFTSDKDLMDKAWDIAVQYNKYAKIIPFDYLEATDLISSFRSRVEKIWNTFTDKEKKAFGTNREEGINELVNFTMDFFISRVLNNARKSVEKEMNESDVYSFKKVYGFSKEENEKAQNYVREAVYKQDLKKQSLQTIESDMNIKKAEMDYSQNSNDSFNELDTNVKQKAFIIMKTNNIKNENEFKQQFAIQYKVSGGGIEQVVYSIANTMPEAKINITNTINALNNQPELPKEETKSQEVNSDTVQKETKVESKPIKEKSEFEELSPKRQNLFYLIMKFKGIDKPTEKDYSDFAKRFKGVKGSGVSDILEDKYNINYLDFMNKYNEESEREKAIKFYNK